jgi:hypothetical protein
LDWAASAQCTAQPSRHLFQPPAGAERDRARAPSQPPHGRLRVATVAAERIRPPPRTSGTPPGSFPPSPRAAAFSPAHCHHCRRHGLAARVATVLPSPHRRVDQVRLDTLFLSTDARKAGRAASTLAPLSSTFGRRHFSDDSGALCCSRPSPSLSCAPR